MEGQSLVENFYEEEKDYYHVEWLSFKDGVLKSSNSVNGEIKNGDIIGENNFKERMKILEESEYFSEGEINSQLLIRKPEECTKAWMSLERIEEGKYLRVSGHNLSSYINPYTCVRLLQKGTIPYEDYLVLSNLLPLCLRKDPNLKLAFCKNGTFITKKSDKF